MPFAVARLFVYTDLITMWFSFYCMLMYKKSRQVDTLSTSFRYAFQECLRRSRSDIPLHQTLHFYLECLALSTTCHGLCPLVTVRPNSLFAFLSVSTGCRREIFKWFRCFCLAFSGQLRRGLMMRSGLEITLQSKGLEALFFTHHDTREAGCKESVAL